MKPNTINIPHEIWYFVLNYLDLTESRRLRLVSKHWNAICNRRVWKKVAFVPSPIVKEGSIDKMMIDAFGVTTKEYYLGDEFLILDYEKLEETSFHIKSMLARYTTSLYIRFSQSDSLVPGEDKKAYQLMATIFQRVKYVELSCKICLIDDRLVAFQALLDQWSPYVAFSIGIELSDASSNGCINVTNMSIKDMYITQEFRNDSWIDSDWILTLPISGDDLQPTAWEYLPSVCTSLRKLDLRIPCYAFDMQWIPQSVKMLRLCNVSGKFYPDPKAIVSSGVECLQVSDVARFGKGIKYPWKTSALEYLDLTRATQIKSFFFLGMVDFITSVDCVTRLRDSLEQLSIQTLHYSGNEWIKDIINSCVDLKVLRIPITASSSTCAGPFPEFFESLPMLQLDRLVLDFGLLKGRGADSKVQFMEKVVISFLKSCPRLRDMEVLSVHGDIPQGFMTKGWVTQWGHKDSCGVSISTARDVFFAQLQ